ncbi:hypothetical protein C8Q69DRAFT_159772 [Paecilomyces variotii]|uniref:BZIP domain-containing protein n=1 Tax=Byssochlamys spectabilis TaxID=264951 RepID=A0A443I231_BYSSP|nr:hypothetical protein C8Q69DRAFT_159772 [Paecilomyces variotii]KAJ9245372.1 hypothetical protein DTO169E5_677 [Paecilomyces variotii]KAJ9252453.1 hypothetical protein DTO207G8_4794 [Paecilomyces variotii]KAJ9290238.1 hypothetical protein DTO021C3_2237 [Paecilomyces variotii]KAJ9364299.1 hypothetical protein DTO280E4_1545 [Paecilomyces variotii]KAJ9392570.1 hypothetical protein DTO063F5_370 [Paecilomyces variotii]
MEVETEQKKRQRLARIRENQRKSRARKQEYIQELEHNLSVCKKQAHQQDINNRISIQKLEVENAKLRQLLSRLGVAPPSVDEYLRGEDNPIVAQKVAIPALRRPEVNIQAAPVESKSGCRTASQPPPQPTSQRPLNLHESITEAAKSLQSLASSMAAIEANKKPACQQGPCQQPRPREQESLQPEQSQQKGSCCGQIQPQQSQPEQPRTEPPQTEQPHTTPPVESPKSEEACDCPPAVEELCGCPPSEGVPESWPSGDAVLNTTLCSVAGELISQYNTRGVDLTEIRKKLWAGFRKGSSAEEGCRVQNQVLFEILNEISGNLS